MAQFVTAQASFLTQVFFTRSIIQLVAQDASHLPAPEFGHPPVQFASHTTHFPLFTDHGPPVAAQVAQT